MGAGNTRRKLAAAKASPIVLNIAIGDLGTPVSGWKFKNLGGPLRLSVATAIWTVSGAGSTTATLYKKVATLTTAVGSATAMTSALALDSTAETQVTFVNSTTPANLVLNTGDVLGVAGTMTTLQGCLLTLTFQPVG